ncbi:hypothetical protein ID866_5641 [Astraeus odoratus]|nr:hypothetical protein ID866_5641 [Astraeus odoratus]
MSRFVRASKYRHVFGQTGKKEYGYDNVKVSSSAWDTNLVAVSARYISINWSASGGGAFAVLPLPSPFGSSLHDVPPKLPDIIPLARTHTAPVLDTAWSPANDTLVASASEDGTCLLWKISDSLFDGWTADGWEPRDLDPVARVDVSSRKVGQVLWHPTAANVLATASGEHLVRLFDLADPARPRTVLNGHGDTIQSFAFNPTGSVLATTCRDRKLRLFDPRTGGDPVRVADGHGGIKGTRVTWMGDTDRIATTGFSKMSDRQVAIWETGGLGSVKMLTLDQSAGVVMPFWSDNGILFLAGKGDGNIRYYEYESDTLYALAEHKSIEPQRGMCFLPRRALEVSECEIARAFKVTSNGVEPVAFIVPRKSESFQSDIYPPAPSSEPSLTAAEFFSGKTAPLNLVSLENGTVFTSNSAPPPTAHPAQSHVVPALSPVVEPVSVDPAPVTPVVVKAGVPPPQVISPPSVRSESLPDNPPQPRISSDDEPDTALEEEVSRLNGELREARQKIRTLELQVEGLKANARKAAQALLKDGRSVVVPVRTNLSRPSSLLAPSSFQLNFIRYYAAQPPRGGSSGGFPGFTLQQQHQKGDALKEYSTDLTDMARTGKLDPVIGRDEEIRRTIQILSRRTKSNPVLIGPPGVGKTAIIEGLASRIVAREVPESLQDKRVLSIDLSAILAGSGIRGQFEEKFKALIRDIEEEAGRVICFIDEVHMLFNLGKAEGGVDGGQMIKPALARGLQLVGATTPDEYRKTIGKDAALERRFQPVQIDEPTVESTISILRGLKPRYEVHHGVEIADSALVTAAVYGARYISDRYLPDKAIDLVDEAASALRLAQESKPDELEALDREIMTLQIELESLKKETDVFSVERRAKLEDDVQHKKAEAEELTTIWQNERARLDRIKDFKKRLEDSKHELEVAQRQGQYERASQLRFGIIPDLERQLPKDGESRDADDESPLAMLHDRVTSNDIARVVAKATGIPVQNLLKGEREKLVHMEEALKQRVVGQDHSVAAISDAVRISRAGLQAPNRPVASFLFLGPTGVGKTELSKALAAFLFNDEQRGLSININMSEYHDRHTISRLIGAAPGYVGFEEGGQLTEAVRRRPYAVILLDELEKAHKDVSMILLQILDEGSLTDSQGRKNTIICLTSNLGSDILALSSSCDANGVVTEQAKSLVMERTSEYFPPELLNRLDSILIFNKLSRRSILDIVSLRLSDVASRLKERRITLDVDDGAKDWLVKRGFSEVYGARAIARIVRTEVLFPLAQKLLKGAIRNGDIAYITVTEDGQSLRIRDNHPSDPRVTEEQETNIFGINV